MNSPKALVSGRLSLTTTTLESSSSSSSSSPPSSSSSSSLPKRSSIFSSTLKFIKSLKPKKLIKSKKHDDDNNESDDSDDNDDSNASDESDDDDDTNVNGKNDTTITNVTNRTMVVAEKVESKLQIAMNEIDNLCKALKTNELEHFSYNLYDTIVYVLQLNDVVNIVVSLDELAEFILSLLNSIDNNDSSDIYSLVLTITNELLIQSTKKYYEINDDSSSSSINIKLKTIHDLLKWFGWWSITISTLTIKQSLSLPNIYLKILTSLFNKKITFTYSYNIINDHIQCLCDCYLFGLYNGDIIILAGASMNLGDMCYSILMKFFNGPSTYLMQHTDGSLYTTLTVTIWELFHINLELAKESKVSMLIMKTIRSLIVILTYTLDHLVLFATIEKTKFVLSSSTLNNSKVIVAKSEGLMFDIMLALTNDCAMQMNELVTVMNEYGTDKEIGDLVSQLGDTLIKSGTSILNEIADILINIIINNKKVDETTDFPSLLAAMNKYLPFQLHKLLPFWTEKLLVILYENFMGVFLRAIINRKTYDYEMINKTMKTIQHEFKEFDPDCVTDTHNDAMNWLLSLFHNISTNNNNSTKKQLKLCHPDDILSLHEVLKKFCNIRNLPIPDIDDIRSNDVTHQQSRAFILKNISKNSTIAKNEPAAITIDKLVLHTSIRHLRINANKISENNAERYRNISINPKKGRRWSRIKLSSS